METSEFFKLLVAAVVGALIKELVAWVIGSLKQTVKAPLWKHNRAILGDFLACAFYVAILVRFGFSSDGITRWDILIAIGSVIGLLVCAVALLISIFKWQKARAALNAATADISPGD